MIYAQLWPQLVDPRNQQRDTKRPTHHRILVVHTLSEAQCKIANGLRGTLDLDALVVRECVVLGRHPGVVDHRAGVGGEPGHRAAQMAVYFHDLLYGGGLEQGRLDTLLDSKDDAFGCAHADGC